MKNPLRLALFVCSTILATAIAASAADHDLEVTKVQADPGNTQITISLTDADDRLRGTPSVSLGGTPLTIVSVTVAPGRKPSRATIVAKLPVGIAGATYGLSVDWGHDSSINTEIALVTQGSQGPAGPQGATGPQGPQGPPGPATTIDLSLGPETVMNRLGIDYGFPVQSVDCPAGQIAVGMVGDGGYTNYGVGIGNLALKCAPILSATIGLGGVRAVTGSVTVTAAVTTTSTPFYPAPQDFSCPAGYGMFRFRGELTIADELSPVVGVNFGCRQIGGADEKFIGGVGIGANAHIDTACTSGPNGGFITGFRVQATDFFYTIRAVCK